MAQFFGMRATQRQLTDPVGKVVELVDAHDELFTALLFEHPPPASWIQSTELVLSFLEYPMVMGLAELAHHDLGRGWFAYRTGPSWLASELMNHHGSTARAMGPRAALELVEVIAGILADAGHIGQLQGCVSHGALTPARLVLGHAGDVQVIGHGILPVAAATERESSADVLRYAPPERLLGAPEDARGDVYALAAIAFEVATGKPLFGGTLDTIRELVTAGEGARALRGAGLPRPIVQLWTEALSPDPGDRPSPEAFAAQAAGLLSGTGPPGAPMGEVLRSHGGTGAFARAHPRSRHGSPAPLLDTGALPFQTLTTASVRPQPIPEPEVQEPELPPSRARWEQVTTEAARARASAPPEPAPAHRRRRRLDPAALASPHSRRARHRATEAAADPTPPGAHVPTPDAAGQADALPDAPTEETQVEPRQPTPVPVLEREVPADADEDPPPSTEEALIERDDTRPSPRRRLTRSGTLSMTSRRRRSGPDGEE